MEGSEPPRPAALHISDLTCLHIGLGEKERRREWEDPGVSLLTD